MNTIIKKYKTVDTNIDDYIHSISNKLEHTIPTFKKLFKIKEEIVTIPTIKNYYDIPKYNYNVQQLKSFSKHYKLKISGNKKELMTRIFIFLHLSSYIIKIQKVFRGNLQRKFNNLRGHGFMKRELCTNNTDFVTMEEIKNIPFNQFYSYQDEDKMIYGFDFISLYNLIFKNKTTKNPYNRNKIPDFVSKNLKTLLRLSNLLKTPINLTEEEDIIEIPNKKVIELRALTLFQNIDALGNYSDPQWFLSLNRNQLEAFLRQLGDIWNYRAQLSLETKRNICPPNGDPFRNLSLYYVHNEPDMNNVKKVILEVLEKFVNNGIDKDSQTLGAYYVLGALTLVNQDAATTMPWLYSSLYYY